MNSSVWTYSSHSAIRLLIVRFFLSCLPLGGLLLRARRRWTLPLSVAAAGGDGWGGTTAVTGRPDPTPEPRCFVAAVGGSEDAAHAVWRPGRGGSWLILPLRKA